MLEPVTGTVVVGVVAGATVDVGAAVVGGVAVLGKVVVVDVALPPGFLCFFVVVVVVALVVVDPAWPRWVVVEPCVVVVDDVTVFDVG